MIARTALAALALSGVLAAPAFAGVVPGLPVDGPSADLVPAAGIDVALAPDGDGAVAYIKKDGGVDHVFVALMRDGALQPPVRVDTGLANASQRPVVAAGNSGRVLVAFLNGAGPAYTARSVELVPGAAAFTAPATIVGDPAVSANTLDLAMEPGGVAYATYTTLGDVRASRYVSPVWTAVGAAFPSPAGVLDKVPSEVAGTAMGEPRVAVAADGAAYVVFGEQDGAMKGRAYVQRLAGTAASGALEVSVSAFGSFPRETFADMVDVDVDAGGTAWIAWRQTFASAGNDPRALVRRFSGGVLGEPTAIDGLTGDPSEGAEYPRIDAAAAGIALGVSARQLSFQTFGSSLANNVWTTGTRLDSLANTAPSFPVTALGAIGDGASAWRNTLGGSPQEIRARVYSAGQYGPEALLSDPVLGATTGAAFEAAADDAGDVLTAFAQGTGASTRIVAGLVDHSPTQPTGTTTEGWLRAAKPLLSWLDASDPWSQLSYRLVVDGAVIGTSSVSPFKPVSPLPDGRHRWHVVAVDARGNETASPDRFLRTDVRPPAIRTKVTGVKRIKKRITLVIQADDGGGSGVAKGTIVRWGDGKVSRGLRLTHVYKKPKLRYVVSITVRDPAGNGRTYKIFIRIKR